MKTDVHGERRRKMLRSAGRTIRQRLLLLVIDTCADEDGVCRLTYADLESLTGEPRGSLTEHIDDLVADGLLRLPEHTLGVAVDWDRVENENDRAEGRDA